MAGSASRAQFPEALRAELASRNPSRRRVACVELGERLAHGEHDVIPLLVGLLEDNHAAIRGTAAAALAEGPSEQVEAAILAGLAALPHPSPPGHRAAFLHALGELERPCEGPLRDALLAHLDHGDPDVRFCALTALNRLDCRDEVYKAAALRLLDDTDLEVAAVAATAVADFGVTEARERVLKRWRGARKFAARQLSLAAAHLGAVEVVPSLREAVKEGVDALAAVEALLALGADPAARETLRWASSAWRAHAVVRARAGVALCEVGDPTGDEVVERHLNARRAELRYSTMEWMGRSPIAALHERLSRILADPAHRDAGVAAYALGFTADERARGWLEAAAQADPRPDVREEARLALSARSSASAAESATSIGAPRAPLGAAAQLVHDL